jgi:hypothetical protein
MVPELFCCDQIAPRLIYIKTDINIGDMLLTSLAHFSFFSLLFSYLSVSLKNHSASDAPDVYLTKSPTTLNEKSGMQCNGQKGKNLTRDKIAHGTSTTSLWKPFHPSRDKKKRVMKGYG